MESGRIARFQVVGMSCGSCVRHVESAVRRVAPQGVDSVEVDLRSGRVDVRLGSEVSVASIADAIRHEGYQVTVVDA